MRIFTANPDMHLGTPDPELARLQLLDTIAFLEERLAEAEEAKDFDLIRWYERELSTKKALLPMTDEDLKILKFHADDMASASEDHTYEDGHALQRVLAFTKAMRATPDGQGYHAGYAACVKDVEGMMKSLLETPRVFISSSSDVTVALEVLEMVCKKLRCNL